MYAFLQLLLESKFINELFLFFFVQSIYKNNATLQERDNHKN